MRLFPCPTCARHVKADDTRPATCPFCEATLLDDGSAREVPVGRWRLHPVAVAALATSMVTIGCLVDNGTMVPMYGLPCPEDGCVSPPAGDAGADGRVLADASIADADASIIDASDAADGATLTDAADAQGDASDASSDAASD